MRTIPNISVLLIPLDEAIDNFVRALFYGYPISDSDRVVFALPIRLGGLGLIIPSKLSDAQYASSVELTQQLRHHITDQQEILNIDDTITRAAKQKLRAEKRGAEAGAATSYCENLTDGLKKRTFEAISEKGASSWLTSLPLAKYGFHLDKGSFRDALRLRYGIPLQRLPATCVCGASYSEAHALSCARGGFVIIRHNDLRDVTCDLLKEVCHDVEKEPLLTPLMGETFPKKSANCSEDAR